MIYTLKTATILKLIFLFIFALFVGTSLGLNAQEKLTNDEIWSGAFREQSLDEIHSMKNETAYTVLQYSVDYRNTRIEKFDYLTGNLIEVVVDSKTQVLIPRFDSYQFSEDETKVLLETDSQPIYRHSKRAIYWVYNLKTKGVEQVFPDPIQEPKFSPTGDKIAFVYNNDLFIKNLINNTLKQITTDGSENIINGITDWVYEEEFGFVRAFDWNSNGTAIAYLRFDQTEVPEYNMDYIGTSLYPYSYKFKYPKAGEKNSEIELKVTFLEQDKTQNVNFGDTPPYYIPRFKFTPQTNILSIQTINRLQNELLLWKNNIETNQSKVVLKETDDAYVDIHDDLKFLKDGSFIWSSDREGFQHLYYYSSKGELKNRITSGTWEVTRFYGFDEKNKKVFYGSDEQGDINRTIYSISLKGKNKKSLTTKVGYNGAAFSSDFKYFINTFENVSTPKEYSLREAKTGKEVREILNNSDLLAKLQPYELPTKEFSTLKINGYDLNMWMLKPHDFDASKHYPLLLFQYSGPGSQQVVNKWNSYNDYWFKLLTQQGFIVACVDGRGTGFKGRDFKKITYLQLAKYETEDQIDAAKLLGERNYIDNSRMGIWGWSFGGLVAANAILKGNDVFSTAIAVAPVTNWRFYDTIYTERFMRTPQENAEGYDSNSPYNFANQLKGNFMIVSGSADDNVHLQNTMRMVEALIQENKDFEWLIYPDKNHGIYGGNTRLHLYNKMTKFLKNNL